jgi:hypothetical protein
MPFQKVNLVAILEEPIEERTLANRVDYAHLISAKGLPFFVITRMRR